MLKFPKDFVWGSSTSGPQTEGRVPGDGKGDNLWDYWYQVEPNRYYNGIGPDKTSTFYENWEKDIELLLETGHTAFRTSIQWSRLSHKDVEKSILKVWRFTVRSLKLLRPRESVS